MTVLDLPTDSPLRSLAETLRRQLETKRDLMADTRLVSFGLTERDGEEGKPAPKPTLDLLVDMPGAAESFTVTRHAHNQIAEHIGVPFKLYDRLAVNHPDLLAGLANGLLSREPSTRMLRTMDSTVRAFLSDRYRPRDNWDLLDGAVLPVLSEFPGRVAFKEASLTDTKMYVKVFLPDVEIPVTPKVGDVIRVGAVIQNSEVGSAALLVAPYSDKLDCLNGMIHTEYGQRRNHVGKRITDEGGAEAWDLYSDETLKLDDEAFFAKVRDTLRSVLNESVFERIVGDMRDLAGLTIPDVPAAVEVLRTRHDMTEDEGRSMLNDILDTSDRSAWGLVNSITATARDLDDADRKADLEALAGRLVHDRDWAVALAA